MDWSFETTDSSRRGGRGESMKKKEGKKVSSLRSVSPQPDPFTGKNMQISGAVGVGIAGGSGQQPPQGASPQNSVGLEEVLQHSKLLMKDEDPERVKRVLILMSDTGGGHRASAQVNEYNKKQKKRWLNKHNTVAVG